ncbi:MAG: glycosyltransferase family 4 protein [Chthoniobacteraceae bacterium]
MIEESPIIAKQRPRILYVSPYWPHRATCASELRALNVARALRQIADVEVFVVGGEGKEDEWNASAEKEFRVAGSAGLSSRPNLGVLRKLRWALDPRSEYPHGCGADAESKERLASLAGQFDLIWFCKLRTPNMFPRWKWNCSVADIDDVPSNFEESMLRSARRLRERLNARRRLYSWRRRDQLLGDRFTVLGVCSDADRKYLQKLGVTAPLHVIPNGFDRPTRTLKRQNSSPPRFGFIGIFDYEPNLGGIRWFAENCWPLVKAAVPDARLRLVGRYSDGPLKPAGPDVDGLGWVEAADEEITTWSAMVVPVQVGAGTRGKIAQAFSLKCPIVSTDLGAYGYEPQDGREMYLANSAEDFANACIRTIREPVEAAAMAERAWQLFLEKWTWEAIRPCVWAAAADCLRLSRGTGGKSSNQTRVEA